MTPQRALALASPVASASGVLPVLTPPGSPKPVRSPISSKVTSMTLQSLLHLQTNGDGVIHRRAFLRRIGAGTAALGAFGWMDAVALSAEEMRKNQMACILLFMRGGPS